MVELIVAEVLEVGVVEVEEIVVGIELELKSCIRILLISNLSRTMTINLTTATLWSSHERQQWSFLLVSLIRSS